MGGNQETYKTVVAVYLVLGLVSITLGATVFYDIPQLNLGTVLHQQKDLRLPTPRHSITEETEVDVEEAPEEKSK